MNKRIKEARIRALKEELANTESLLKKRLKIEEKNKLSNLRKLLENDLDQAKLILASQDVIEKLQKIAERLAELNAEEVMPLSDSMKAAFGPDMAHQFEHVASESIQTALEAVRGAKDAIDNAVLQVEGKIAPGSNNDMASYDDNADASAPTDAGVQPPADGSQPSEPADDTVLGTDTQDAPAPEAESPLGRETKESIDYKKIGKKVLESHKLTTLVNWMVEKNIKENPQIRAQILERIKVDPVATAGWISSQKTLFESKIVESRSEKMAKAIATVIEANVENFGSGRAAKVMSQFVDSGLTEDQSNNILEAFQRLYNCSPAVYSAKKKRAMEAVTDTGDAASGSTNSDPNTTSDATPATPPGSNPTNDAANSATAKIAQTAATTPAAMNQPVSSATSNLTAQEKTAINTKIQQMASKTGDASPTVKDFLQNDKVDENVNEPKWPVNSKGQYKGSPMETDYGKLKPKNEKPSAKETPKPKTDTTKSSKTPEEMDASEKESNEAPKPPKSEVEEI